MSEAAMTRFDEAVRIAEEIDARRVQYWSDREPCHTEVLARELLRVAPVVRACIEEHEAACIIPNGRGGGHVDLDRWSLATEAREEAVAAYLEPSDAR